MKCSGLGNRDRCLEEAMLFRDTDLIKAITGVRRCGESGLIALTASCQLSILWGSSMKT